MALRTAGHTREQSHGENFWILLRRWQLTLGANSAYSFGYIGDGTKKCDDSACSALPIVGRSIFLDMEDRDDTKKWKNVRALARCARVAVRKFDSDCPAVQLVHHRHPAHLEARDALHDRRGIRA